MKVITKIFILIFLSSNILLSQEDSTVVSELDKLYDMSLEELLPVPVSSATKFEEPLKKLPFFIYILSKDDIESFGYRTPYYRL